MVSYLFKILQRHLVDELSVWFNVELRLPLIPEPISTKKHTNETAISTPASLQGHRCIGLHAECLGLDNRKTPNITIANECLATMGSRNSIPKHLQGLLLKCFGGNVVSNYF